MSALLESGDIRGTEGTLVEVERLVGELRQPSYMWIARLGRTMLAVMRGAPDAEAQVLATFELGTASNQPDARDGLAAQLSGVRHNQGRLAELADTMRIIVEAQPHIPAWRALLALLYSETDQVAEAREQIDILRLNGFDYPPNWAWSMYMLSLSETVCDLHDTPAAAVLYERLRPVASQVGTSCAVSVCQGSYALYCGMLAACLGCWDDAERHFGEALSMNERLGARPYLVRTRRAWGSMLLDRGAPGDAARTNELLAAGLAEARELGMAREIVRIERLLEHMDVARPG
jgi:tetratricopeptide (TPR) repeat protein